MGQPLGWRHGTGRRELVSLFGVPPWQYCPPPPTPAVCPALLPSAPSPASLPGLWPLAPWRECSSCVQNACLCISCLLPFLLPISFSVLVAEYLICIHVLVLTHECSHFTVVFSHPFLPLSLPSEKQNTAATRCFHPLSALAPGGDSSPSPSRADFCSRHKCVHP